MLVCCSFFFCRQKTAYDIRISDWSSDVCSSDHVGADGWRLLDGLGLDPVRSGGEPIERIRLVRGERMVQSPLPFPAVGLSRRTPIGKASVQERVFQCGKLSEYAVALKKKVKSML